MRKSGNNRNRKDFSRHLGRRIANRRLETGQSAAELDRLLSLAPGSITAFENGRRSIGAVQLFMLSRALGVPVTFFMEDSPVLAGVPLDDLPPPDTIAEAERFLNAFYKIGDANLQRDILGFVKAAGESTDIGRDG